MTEPVLSDNRVIKVWRGAYSKFKTKKGARCAIEALMKRIPKDNHLGTINPIVNIYNSVSLSHAMPCGGEDIDCMEEDLLLAKSNKIGLVFLAADKMSQHRTDSRVMR